MGRRDTLTVGELRSMLDGVDDSLEVYVQKSVTPLGSHDYIDAHGGEVAKGVDEGGSDVNFPAPEDIEEKQNEEFGTFETKDYFLIFP